MKPMNPTQIRAKLKKMSSHIDNMSIPHKKISIMLDQWVQRNFKTQGGQVGGWAAIKREGSILQLSGRLRLSFIPFFDKKDAGIGSELPYSKKHNEGIGVKKRRILPELSEVKRDITSVYNDHIRKAAK